MMNIFLLDCYINIKVIYNGEVFKCLPNKVERGPDIVFKDNISSIHLLGNKKCV